MFRTEPVPICFGLKSTACVIFFGRLFWGGRDTRSSLKLLSVFFKTVKTLELVNMKTMINMKVVPAEVLGPTPKPGFQNGSFVVHSRVNVL